MSGYLDVKSPFKSSKGFSTWKVWKKQWCTLRPCPVKSGIAIVIHSSAGVSNYSQVDIPGNVIVYRIVSKTKPHAFGIFTTEESEKPLLYLSGNSESESQLWMFRIRMMINGKNCTTEKCGAKKKYFNVSLIDNEFSKICGFKGLYGNLIVNSDSFEICGVYRNEVISSIEYKNISSINFLPLDSKLSDYQKICVIKTNSKYKFGSGELLLYSSFARLLVTLLRKRLNCSEATFKKLNRRISRSEGCLINTQNYKDHIEDTKEYEELTIEQSPNRYTRSYLDSILFSPLSNSKLKTSKNNSIFYNTDNFYTTSLTDRRCSNISRASGVYEEISENVDPMNNDSINCTYESLSDFIYLKNSAIKKKCNPPPLPPRFKAQIFSDIDGIKENLLYSGSSQYLNDIKSPMKNASTISLDAFSYNTDTREKLNDGRNDVRALCKLPLKNSSRFYNAFDAFRRRIKSESYVQKNKNTKYESNKLNPEMNTDACITPTKSIGLFRNIRLGRGVKSDKFNDLKSAKQNAASCEDLDKQPQTDIAKSRLSKSHDCLDTDLYDSNKIKRYKIDLSKNWSMESSDDKIEDLSLLCAEDSFKHEYPDDIIDSVLKGDVNLVEKKLRQRSNEEEYVVMSPMGLQTSKQENTPKDSLITGENNYLIMRGA